MKDQTDRELLEAAAKAAGVDPELIDLQDDYDRPAWNPLTDDGDALRLAVKLRMNIVITEFGPSARCEASPSKWADERCAAGSDYEAATRRAIVRAAASIGATK